VNKNYKRSENREILIGVASLLFQQSTSYKISRLLENFIIKTVNIHAENSSNILRTAKDDLTTKILGVYAIPCECGKVYIARQVCSGRTQHSIRPPETMRPNYLQRGSAYQRGSRNKITSGQYKQRGRVQTQQSIESQQQIKAIQHTQDMKILSIHREEHAKKTIK
jgi:hypothetical protein